MILASMTLRGFRNYETAFIRFSPNVTLISGPNASGKTNVIEAIYLLATAKSFRAERDRDMISWKHEVGHIKGTYEDTELEIVLTSGLVGGQKTPGKKCLVNGVSRRMIDFVGHLPVVLFWPEDLELVTDSPGLRRRYLDGVLTQVDREYRRCLLSYERGLRQRNRLLGLISEGKAGRPQLLFWDQLLIKTGNYMTEARHRYIEYINAFRPTDLPKKYKAHFDRYQTIYDKSVISPLRLAQYADEEVAAKATLVGPHRDDMQFMMKTGDGTDRSVTDYGSRGEQRLAVFWLKLAELSFLEERSSNRPVLLLDDIFSEFDALHRELVLHLITRQQTVITTAEDEAKTHLTKTLSGYSLIRLPLATDDATSKIGV